MKRNEMLMDCRTTDSFTINTRRMALVLQMESSAVIKTIMNEFHEAES
jgi:hypothetical protein